MKVFIGSVEAGYEEFRAVAAQAVEAFGHQVVRAESLPASIWTPQQACLQEVRRSDLMVLLLGERYGNRQASGLSATHEEYLEAVRERKPVLLFVERCAAHEPDQQAFLESIDEWATGHFRANYATPEQLQTAVLRSLHQYELAMLAGPADEAELLVRARALLPDDRRSGIRPQLILVTATGPRYQVLRPSELEGDGLRRDIQAAAMFGQHQVFDDRAATRSGIEGDALTLEQPGAAITLDELGTIRIVQAVRRDNDLPLIAIPSLVEEDLGETLTRAIRFTGWVLDRIDPLGRLTDVVPLACLNYICYLPWRTRAEQTANPGAATITIDTGTRRITAALTPARRHRRALDHDGGDIAEDLITLLRRQLRH